MKYILKTLTLALLFFCNNLFSQYKDGFVSSQFVTGLSNPTSIAIAPDGRIFVSEKSGLVRVIVNNELLSQPVLSIKVDEYNERGLSSIILDPNFDSNGYLYAYFNEQLEERNIIKRFTLTSNTAIVGKDTVIFELDKLSAAMHNGGAMKFASDGTLFVAVGEGGYPVNSQNLNNVLGKMLRINSDGTIPTDNPFYNQLQGKNRSIYAYGLRNPFTFDLDPATQRIFVNDVGQVSWEEINDILPGKNYGWPQTEGYLKAGNQGPENYVDPIYSYSHQYGCAIVGGAFYNASQTNWPDEFKGKYIFSDFCSNFISVMDTSTGVITDTLAKYVDDITGFSVSPTGSLYFISFYTGVIWEIQYIGNGKPFISVQPKPQTIVKNSSLELFVDAIGDTVIHYEWFVNEQSIANSDTSTLTLKDTSLSLNNAKVFCKVWNLIDTIYTDTVDIIVQDNIIPEAIIDSLPKGYLYSAGDFIEFTGNGFDEDDGVLTNDKLSWKVDFHHNIHTHPVLTWSNTGNKISFSIPKYGELDTNVFYRIYLKATDSQDFFNVTYYDIFPKIINFTIESNVAGIEINLDGTPTILPTNIRCLAGISRSMEAKEYLPFNTSFYNFNNWNNLTSKNLINFDLALKDTSIKANFTYVDTWTPGTGEGLYARYYANATLSGVPFKEQVDPFVDFFWDWGGPIGMPNDDFSITWSGNIEAPVTGEYTFYFVSNDYIKFQFDDQILINNWGLSSGENEDSIKINLNGGDRYQIVLDYAEKKWQSKMVFSWKIPYSTQKTVVPSDVLYPSLINGFDSSISSGISIFPNPVVEKTAILSSKPIKEITINGTNGRTIRTIKVGNLNTYTLDIPELTLGTYILTILFKDDSFATTKLVKLE